MSRESTRRERYDDKKRTAETYPISLCCVNFKHDGNLGFLIRAAACFGAQCVHVIGSIPSRKLLNSLSGSLYDYIEIKQYANPNEFLDYAKNHNVQLVSAEIHESSKPLASYAFGFYRDTCLVVGNEEIGVPAEILAHSDIVHIPMPGVGVCLNTSQTANIMLYEASRQYARHQKYHQEWGEWDSYHLP